MIAYFRAEADSRRIGDDKAGRKQVNLYHMRRRNFIKWASLAGAAGVIPGKRALAESMPASAADLTPGTATAAAAIAATPAALAHGTPDGAPAADRAYWTALLEKMAAPILDNMSRGALRKNMPVEYSPTWPKDRERSFAYMEAFGRLIAGLAPWLALPEDNTPEGKTRTRLKNQTLQCLAAAVDPANPDYLNWDTPGQPLVDAAYIANTFLRAPQVFWAPLDQVTKDRYVASFKKLRHTKPAYNNWLLFAAMVETFLLSIGADYDPLRIEIALHKMDEWYAGDGWYADGPRFHFDYYNGYVIQPMLVEILDVLGNERKSSHDLALKRMQRYATSLERMISPEGAYPPVGRSATYRVGAFQPLGLLALRNALPEGIAPAQVRCALTAVMKRMFEMPGVFADGNWLTLGFAGHQPGIADVYSNSGSMYITSVGFLPLGLPPDHAFWSEPFTDWTQRKAWGGQPFAHDYAVDY